MQIFVAQLNPTIGAFEKNCSAIRTAILQAKREGCDLIVFPEMAICGYMPDDLLQEPGFLEDTFRALESLIEETEGLCAIIGLARRQETEEGSFLYNSAAVIANKELLGFQDKLLLPTYDVFDERRYFEPAKSQRIWQLAGKKVAICICEDIWVCADRFHQERYQSDPLSFFEEKDLDLCVNISASPYSLGKTQVRKKLAHHVAARLGCPFLLVNQVGAQDGLIFDGASLCVAEQRLLFQAVSFKEECRSFTLQTPHCVKEVLSDPAQELYEALCLGIKDYFAKQGFCKAVIGLSGGIDSSVVACLAAEALGKEQLLGVLLPSRYTSDASRQDALALAERLGIEFQEISIEGPFQAALQVLEPLEKGRSGQMMEENVQSRIRGMLLMAICNAQGSLLLNTGNKSELAVGYTTLYGDGCGAVGVIGDLLKRQVYQLAEWINKQKETIPPSVLVKAPTAELRPNQKDSDSLPEYPILDVIVEEYIVQQLPAQEIARRHGFDILLVEEIIKKIHANEYKRRQMPFSLRISEKAFSCGRRIPIVHRLF